MNTLSELAKRCRALLFTAPIQPCIESLVHPWGHLAAGSLSRGPPCTYLKFTTEGLLTAANTASSRLQVILFDHTLNSNDTREEDLHFPSTLLYAIPK